MSQLMGCVSTTYSKSITVRRDETGKVIETMTTESIVQPNQTGHAVKFENLKDVQ